MGIGGLLLKEENNGEFDPKTGELSRNRKLTKDEAIYAPPQPIDPDPHLLSQEGRLSVVPKHDVGTLNLLHERKLRCDTCGNILLGEAATAQAGPTDLIGTGHDHDRIETSGEILLKKQRDFDDVISRGVGGGLSPQARHRGMRDGFQESTLTFVRKDFGGDPLSVRPALGIQASSPPTFLRRLTQT